MKWLSLIVVMLATAAHAQAPKTPCNSGNLNAAYSDNVNNVQYLCTTVGWKQNIGNGAPTVACAVNNYGQTYTDVSGAVTYQCGVAGWFQNGGSAGTGTVQHGLQFALAGYTAAGSNATVGPSQNLYALTPAMTVTQINTLLASLASSFPGTATVLIPDGVVTGPGIINTNVGVYSVARGDVYLQTRRYGVACDGEGLFLTFTQGSNQVFVGSDMGTEAVGKSFFVARRSGYTYADTQASFEPAITAVNTGTQYATLSGNSPFTFTGWVSFGTDNTTQAQAMLEDAGYAFPITIPTGCRILTKTLSWDKSQSFIAQQQNNGGFIGPPGRDVLQSPDVTGQGANGAGIRIENLGIQVNTNIDASLPWTDYGSTGTAVAQAPLYRPLGQFEQPANDPLAPGWISNGKNGVASVTAGSAVICVPTSLGYVPTVTQTIMFPYFTSIFTATVSSNTGAGCAGGFTGSTLSAPVPAGDTNTQAEWFTGTAIQSTTTTIPATGITYPLTVLLTLPTNPIPGWTSNFSTHGHIKLCGSEFDYMGVNGYSSPYEIILRKGPTTSNGCSGTTPLAPLNPCSAHNLFGSSSDVPWPVIPSINAGDSTPAGATFFPGWCGGNYGIAFPSLNADTYVASGLVNSKISGLYITPAAGQPQYLNQSGGVYLAGNYTGYAVTWDRLQAEFLTFGFSEGPSSSGQQGVIGVATTSAGNNWSDCSIRAGYPIILINAEQGGIHRCDTYTTEYSPYDGTLVGPGTALFLGYTLGEQTGAVASNVSTNFTVDDWNSEPEFVGGNADEVGAYAVLECSYCHYVADSFEGSLTTFAGDHQSIDGSTTIAVPAINYGTSNHFENLGNLNVGYILNKWHEGGNNNQFYNWGTLTSCSSNMGGAGAIQNCSAGNAQTYNGRTMESGVAFDYATPFQNSLGGQIRPGEWNCSASFDSFPMSTCFTSDESEQVWGSYATCNISTTALCQPSHHPTTFIYIGPFNRLAPRPYVMAANLRMAANSNNVAVSISVFDDGSGNCANPASNVASQTFTIGTTWVPKYLPVDLSTRQGCILALQWGPGSATDTLDVGAVDFVPAPKAVLGPTSAPTEGGSCPVNNTWLGVFSGFSYFCDGNVVKRSAVS